MGRTVYYNIFFQIDHSFLLTTNSQMRQQITRRNSAVDGGFGGKSLLFINNRLPKVVIESGKKFGSIIFKNNRVVTKIIF